MVCPTAWPAASSSMHAAGRASGWGRPLTYSGARTGIREQVHCTLHPMVLWYRAPPGPARAEKGDEHAAEGSIGTAGQSKHGHTRPPLAAAPPVRAGHPQHVLGTRGGDRRRRPKLQCEQGYPGRGGGCSARRLSPAGASHSPASKPPACQGAARASRFSGSREKQLGGPQFGSLCVLAPRPLAGHSRLVVEP